MSAAPISTMRKNSREEIRISLDHLNGHDLLFARVWYEADDGERRLGKAGLAIKAELLPEFADAVGAALDQARAKGLCR